VLLEVLAIGVAGAPGHGGLMGEGETKREERGSHGAAYLGRKTTAAARRRDSGSAGGGPRRQQCSGGRRSMEKGRAWATRLPRACGGVGCSGWAPRRRIDIGGGGGGRLGMAGGAVRARAARCRNRLGHRGEARRLGVSSPDAEAWRRRTPAESPRRPVQTTGWARMGFVRAGAGPRRLVDRAGSWVGAGRVG
jgi:hypothetical protein